MSYDHSLEYYVRQHAGTMPDKTAVICGDKSITYGRLWQDILSCKDRLIAKGLKAGELNAFKTTQDADFLCQYMATHLTGAVAVPLSETKDIITNEDLNGIADVLFTTGSTGKQKGVKISMRAIMADAENLILAQGFSADTVFVICGPLNHIGSLSKIWPILVLGGTLIILDGMKDINAFFDAFNYPSHHLATFMVPASIRMALTWGKERLSKVADKIEFIETGGAAISQTDMEALCRILPRTRLYNTYASTETGIVCTYDYNHNPCKEGCVGPVMKNSSVAISDDGTIVCGGNTVMSGYLNDEELSSKILHDGKVYTSDLGSKDNEGRLHIIGRNDDIINIGGYKVSPQEVESAALSHPLIADCICTPFCSPIFGQTCKLEYVVKSDAELSKTTLARFLASKLESYKVPRVFEQVTKIKHLFNGKLDRKSANN